MPKIGQARVYVLSDGSSWKARQLADKLDLTTTACRYRLDQSHDIKRVMREHHKPSGRKRGSGSKTYELSDGSVMSATAIAKSMNIHPSTIQGLVEALEMFINYLNYQRKAHIKTQKDIMRHTYRRQLWMI
jgi:hypothetical protein